jgi:hypothetical protein
MAGRTQSTFRRFDVNAAIKTAAMVEIARPTPIAIQGRSQFQNASWADISAPRNVIARLGFQCRAKPYVTAPACRNLISRAILRPNQSVRTFTPDGWGRPNRRRPDGVELVKQLSGDAAI